MAEDATTDVEPDTPRWPGEAALDWYVEATRRAVERSLSAQQAAVDGWATTVEGRSEDRPGPGTPVRGAAWAFDVWAETLQNAFVHLDDAIDADGIDLEALQTIWLHAVDDAITDVGRSEEFAATMTESVEGALVVQGVTDDVWRAMLGASGAPTDGDVEEVGKRLLDLERSQKAIEDKLDAVLDALDESGEERPETEIEIESVDDPGTEVESESMDETDASEANETNGGAE